MKCCFLDMTWLPNPVTHWCYGNLNTIRSTRSVHTPTGSSNWTRWVINKIGEGMKVDRDVLGVPRRNERGELRAYMIKMHGLHV